MVLNENTIKEAVYESVKELVNEEIKKKQLAKTIEEGSKAVIDNFIQETIGICDTTYTMEDWVRDRTLSPKMGQKLSYEVFEQLRDCVPPETYRRGLFQPGEPYDFDKKTQQPLYMTFEMVGQSKSGEDIYRYIGLKPTFNKVQEEGKKLNEAYDPIQKVQAMIDAANNAYRDAKAKQEDTLALMDKEGTTYGLKSDIKLDGRGYIHFPFVGASSYSSYTPEKIKVLTKVGGKVRLNLGDFYDSGWKDALKLLKQIIKDAEIGNGHFEQYDPNWEDAESKEDFNEKQKALRDMNKRIGRKANVGSEYIEKKY